MIRTLVMFSYMGKTRSAVVSLENTGILHMMLCSWRSDRLFSKLRIQNVEETYIMTDALRGVFPMSFAGELVKTGTATFLYSSPSLLHLLLPSHPPLISAILVLLCHFGSSTPSPSTTGMASTYDCSQLAIKSLFLVFVLCLHCLAAMKSLMVVIVFC